MRQLIFGVLLGCVVLIANASDESLTIGGVRLTLGMERSKALELLQKNSTVSCLAVGLEQKPTECDLAVTRGNKTGTNFNFLGSVYFTKAGRVKIVMKNYDQSQWDSDPAKFVSFLYEVLRQYGEKGETFVSSITEVREPGWVAKTIFFRSGRKLISVVYGEGGQDGEGKPYRPFVTMSEKLE
jgi:hypothetical protein